MALTRDDHDYIRRRVGSRVDDGEIGRVYAQTGSKHGTVVEILTRLLGEMRAKAGSLTIPGQVAQDYSASMRSLEAAIKAEEALWLAEQAGDSGVGPVAAAYNLERASSSWGR